MDSISCSGIKKIFGEGPTKFEALRGIDLHVKEQELLMLVGPSGSGKTTLLSIIGGIMDQTDGSCQIFDQDLSNLGELEKDRFRKSQIGFIFQSFNLIPMLSALENVSIPLLLNGMEEKQALEKSTSFLEKLGLSDKINSLPRQLSTGQQQRVSIARGCVHHPKLLLCDEPTSYLDHKSGQTVMELIQQIRHEEKCTVIVVTHDPRIFDYADRIEQIEDGMISPYNHRQ